MSDSTSATERLSVVITAPEIFLMREAVSHGPGVDERRRARWYLGLDSAPEVDSMLKGQKRTFRARLVLREFGYMFLERVERLRRRFRHPVEAPQLIEPRQYLYRGSVRSALVRRLLAPPFALSSRELLPSPGELRDLTWFERSRRIVEFERAHSPLGEDMRVVFYLFAADRRDTTERLYSWYLRRALTDELTWVYERESGLVMCSRPLQRIRSTRLSPVRRYFDVAILPEDLVDLEQILASWKVHVVDSVDLAPEIQLPKMTPRVSLNTDMDVDPLRDSHFALPRVRPRPAAERVTFDEDYERQADANWHFILGEIATASAQGRPLDEEFVHQVAERQVDHAAATANFGSRPGAGPSPQSAELMVRSVVDLYLDERPTHEIPHDCG
jgi:hypothetical protein